MTPEEKCSRPDLTTQEEAWLEQELATAPPLSEVQRSELAILLSAQDRARVRREHHRLLADCSEEEAEWLVTQHLSTPRLTIEQAADLARLQAGYRGRRREQHPPA